MLDHETPPSSNSKVVTSVHHEPQLFVPPSSPFEPNKTSTTSSSSVPLSSPSDSPNLHKSNPYARGATSGHRPRPMFPSNQQFFQLSSTPLTNASPNVQSSYAGSTPHPPAMETTTKNISQSLPETPSALSVSTPAPPPSNSQFYQLVVPHWFFSKSAERSSIWCPFSQADSSKLDMLYQKGQFGSLA